MKIKIRKDEALFSEEGLHILDDRGAALIAQEDTECEVADEHYERVRQIVVGMRLRYGLDENGDIPAPPPEPVAEPVVEPEPVAEPVVEPEPVAEPVAEPVVEPEPVAEDTPQEGV